MNEEPQLYDDRTLETMTLLAFAAQLTAAILYSSAVYCVLYNNCTVPYNNSTQHGSCLAARAFRFSQRYRVEKKKIGIESSF